MKAVAFGLSTVSVPALAADLPNREIAPTFVQPAADGFDITIGAGPYITNQFPGAKSVTVLPSIHLNYRKAGEPEPFYAPDDSFDIGIYQNEYFRIGPAANYINNRSLSNGNGNFFGLHTIGGTFEVGGFAEVYPIPGHVRIRGEILKGVTGSKGLVGNLGADVYQQFGVLTLSVGPRAGFGDNRYASQYFSVTPGEAALNGLVPAYNATGGLTSIGGFATAKYQFSPKWYALAFGGYSRLVNSVGASPVATTLGTRNQFTAGVTLNYTFAFKGFGILGY